MFPGIDDDPAPDGSSPNMATRASADAPGSEPLQPVVVVTYSGRSQEDAAAKFAQDAAMMAEDGYAPVSQSWADGRSGCLRFILLGGFGALILKPDGTLTVTYELHQHGPPRR